MPSPTSSAAGRAAAMTTHGALIIPPKPGEKSLRRQTVLEEDAYTSGLSRIIQRDFFPDLPRLRAENAYLGALEQGHPDAIEETARRLVLEEERSGVLEETTRRGDAGEPLTPLDVPVTPSSTTPMRPGSLAHTPYGGASLDTPRSVAADEAQDGIHASVRVNMSLDAYQAHYTSEDNASFAQLMQVAQKQRRARHQWAYNVEDVANTQQRAIEAARQHEGEQGRRLALPAPDTSSALIMPPPPVPPTSQNQWKFQTRNAFMFGPDADVDTLTARSSSRPTVLPPASGPDAPRIRHANTRLADDAGLPATPSTPSSSVVDAAIRGDTPARPQVRGYAYVDAVPSPRPEALGERRMQQLMTWGRLAATPRRLDTPSSTSEPLTPRSERADPDPPRASPSTATPSGRRSRAGPHRTGLSPAGRVLLRRTGGRRHGLYTAPSSTPRTTAKDAAHAHRVAAQRWTPAPSPHASP